MKSSVFKRSLFVTLPYFINACGTIGISLLPMILVSKKLSVGDSTMVMTTVKACILIGVLMGGWMADHLGLRTSLIISFSVSGLGLGLLPWSSTTFLLLIFGCLAQLGTSMYAGQGRLLISDLLPVEDRQEAIGWLRVGNNMGQIVSYSIGYLFSAFGFTALLLFDAFTSILAMMMSIKKIPRSHEVMAARKAQMAEALAKKKDWFLFILTALSISGFSFMYELYQSSTAARCQILFGSEGLKTFSKIMVINCVICTVLAVAASRHIRNPRIAFPVGISLMGLGSYFTIISGTSQAWLYLGAFVVTAGEIFFTAIAAFVMIHVMPQSKNRGALNGMALLIQNVGRILGGAAAFPMVVHGANPILFISISAVAVLAITLCFSLRLKPDSI